MNPIGILPLEDNIFVSTATLRRKNVVNTLNDVKDRWEGLEFLEKIGVYTNVETSDMILQDVNLPKLNGHEVLKEINFQEHLKHLPVIMSSVSSSPGDQKSAFKNYANCYFAKLVDMNDILDVNASTQDFWISIVQPLNSINTVYAL